MKSPILDILRICYIILAAGILWSEYMNSYFGVMIVLIYMFLMFSAMGSIVCGLFRFRADFGMKLIYGGAIYFLLFSLVYIPIQFTAALLKPVVIIWICISVLVFAGYTVFCVADRRRLAENIPRWKKQDWIIAAGFVALALFEIIFSMSITRYTSNLDSAHYNGLINSFVYRGTLDYCDPYTGIGGRLDAFKTVMVYEVHAATLASMFHIHPLIIVNRVMGIYEIAANLIIVALIAKQFFKEPYKILLAAALVFLVSFAMSGGTVYTGAAFLFYRLGEAKSITANITLPLIWLVAGYLFTRPGDREIWILLLLVTVAALLINDSALFLVPVCLVIVLLPLIIYHRKRSVLLHSLLCLVPCMVWMGFYLLS